MTASPVRGVRPAKSMDLGDVFGMKYFAGKDLDKKRQAWEEDDDDDDDDDEDDEDYDRNDNNGDEETDQGEETDSGYQSVATTGGTRIKVRSNADRKSKGRPVSARRRALDSRQNKSMDNLAVSSGLRNLLAGGTGDGSSGRQMDAGGEGGVDNDELLPPATASTSGSSGSSPDSANQRVPPATPGGRRLNGEKQRTMTRGLRGLATKNSKKDRGNTASTPPASSAAAAPAAAPPQRQLSRHQSERIVRQHDRDHDDKKQAEQPPKPRERRPSESTKLTESTKHTESTNARRLPGRTKSEHHERRRKPSITERDDEGRREGGKPSSRTSSKDHSNHQHRNPEQSSRSNHGSSSKTRSGEVRSRRRSDISDSDKQKKSSTSKASSSAQHQSEKKRSSHRCGDGESKHVSSSSHHHHDHHHTSQRRHSKPNIQCPASPTPKSPRSPKQSRRRRPSDSQGRRSSSNKELIQHMRAETELIETERISPPSVEHSPKSNLSTEKEEEQRSSPNASFKDDPDVVAVKADVAGVDAIIVEGEEDEHDEGNGNEQDESSTTDSESETDDQKDSDDDTVIQLSFDPSGDSNVFRVRQQSTGEEVSANGTSLKISQIVIDPIQHAQQLHLSEHGPPRKEKPVFGFLNDDDDDDDEGDDDLDFVDPCAVKSQQTNKSKLSACDVDGNNVENEEDEEEEDFDVSVFDPTPEAIPCPLDGEQDYDLTEIPYPSGGDEEYEKYEQEEADDSILVEENALGKMKGERGEDLDSCWFPETDLQVGSNDVTLPERRPSGDGEEQMRRKVKRSFKKKGNDAVGTQDEDEDDDEIEANIASEKQRRRKASANGKTKKKKQDKPSKDKAVDDEGFDADASVNYDTDFSLDNVVDLNVAGHLSSGNLHAPPSPSRIVNNLYSSFCVGEEHALKISDDEDLSDDDDDNNEGDGDEEEVEEESEEAEDEDQDDEEDDPNIICCPPVAGEAPFTCAPSQPYSPSSKIKGGKRVSMGLASSIGRYFGGRAGTSSRRNSPTDGGDGGGDRDDMSVGSNTGSVRSRLFRGKSKRHQLLGDDDSLSSGCPF